MNTLLHFAQSSSDFTTYTTTTTTNSSVSAGVAAGFIIGYFVAIIITYVITALLLGKIFKKAGVANWVAWVPFYNTWKALEIGGQQGFWSILFILPFVNIVAAIFVIIAFYNIGLKLGKSGAFVLLGIFLPIVWLIWLAVDKSVWNEALGAPSKAPEHAGQAPAVATIGQASATPVAPASEAPVTPPNDQTPPTTPPSAPTA